MNDSSPSGGKKIKHKCVKSSYKELMFYVTPFEVEIEFP